MAFPEDPRDLEVGFAFGEPPSADPTAVTYEAVSPGDADDPGPVLDVIRITRGRVGNAGTTQPTTIEMALRNDSGEFSPRNVEGEHYGELRKGTPMQVRLDAGSGLQVRGRGTVPDFNPRWDGTREDGTRINPRVPITALGVLSRLGEDRESLSAIRRTVLASSPRAYWPLEDGFDAAVAGAGVSGVAPLRIVGSISFAQDETLPGSSATPDMSAGALIGTPPGGGSSTAWFVEFWLLANYNAGSRAAYIQVSGSPDFASMGIRQPGSASGQIDIALLDASGSPTGDIAIGPVTGWAEDVWHHIAIVAEQNGSAISVTIYGDGDLLAVNPIASTTLGQVAGVAINDFDAFSFADVISAAHLVVGDGTTPTDSALAGDGYTGEEASDRIDRLCDEEGIAVVVTSGNSAPMGTQKPATLLALLRECEATDHGVLYELRDGRLGYKPLASLYNLDVDLALSYTDLDVTDLVPFDDDRDIYNIITVTRDGGSSATAELATGPLGTDETDGIGPRPLPVRLSLASDDQLPDQAGWILHLTTVEAQRQLVMLDYYSVDAIRADALALDIGSRITVTGAPAEDVGPDDLDLIVVGIVETLAATVGRLELYCEPYAPFNLAEVEHDDLGILGTDSAIIRESLDTTETGIDITCGAGPDWVHEADFDVVVGGERMTVTAVAAMTGTFPIRITTLTVVRSVNGVVKTHALNDPIRLFHQAYIGL